MSALVIDGHCLRIDDLVAVARLGGRAEISPEAIRRMEASRAVVDRAVEEGRVCYGITTGFGKFCDVSISREDNEALQRNLIMSHACGVGEPFAEEIVRAMMLLRANALAIGYSGIRPATVQALLDMLNAGILPFIPEKGSLGASGDLAPLSHLALALCGMGECIEEGRRVDAETSLSAKGLKPIRLSAKEGLALINGTQAMSAVAALVIYDARRLAFVADLAAALTHQALRGITAAYDPRVHELRGQPGQIRCAANLRGLLDGSGFTTAQGELRVQDAYALRCVPQVHGASRDAIEYAAATLEREMNAVTDNPLIVPAENGSGEADIISGGNFHGQPVALAMDFLGIALAELANIAERRIERLVNPSLSNGLPAFLTERGGLHSGLMIAQYSAASLVSENKVLAHPASVDSIPSSANQEDHVSMGTIAARKARQIQHNLEAVLAIELMCAAQGLDLRAASMKKNAEELLSPASLSAYEKIRALAPRLEGDRILYRDIEAIRAALADGSFLRGLETA